MERELAEQAPDLVREFGLFRWLTTWRPREPSARRLLLAFPERGTQTVRRVAFAAALPDFVALAAARELAGLGLLEPEPRYIAARTWLTHAGRAARLDAAA